MGAVVCLFGRRSRTECSPSNESRYQRLGPDFRNQLIQLGGGVALPIEQPAGLGVFHRPASVRNASNSNRMVWSRTHALSLRGL